MNQAVKVRARKARVRRAEIPLTHERALTSRDFWWWSSLAILAVAALLRLVLLTQKPLHHDEGVNGNFLANLFRTGTYYYDPSNYHGPSLYYFALIPTAINNLLHWGHGLSTFGIRFVTATFGVGVVWLMLCLRRFLGSTAALAAAAFATVSPGFVFFSRYFIHEILFVFFSLGTIVAWLWYHSTGKPKYLMLASASAALLFTTKETWIITACRVAHCYSLYHGVFAFAQARVRSTAMAARSGRGQRQEAVRESSRHFCGYQRLALLFFLRQSARDSGFRADVHLLDQDRPKWHL